MLPILMALNVATVVLYVERPPQIEISICYKKMKSYDSA